MPRGSEFMHDPFPSQILYIRQLNLALFFIFSLCCIIFRFTWAVDSGTYSLLLVHIGSDLNSLYVTFYFECLGKVSFIATVVICSCSSVVNAPCAVERDAPLEPTLHGGPVRLPPKNYLK